MKFYSWIVWLILTCYTIIESKAQDTVTVKGITITSDVQKGIQGVNIFVSFKDTIITGRDDVIIEYTINNREFRRVVSTHMKPNTIDFAYIFHPYSQLFKSMGEHEVKFILNGISVKGKNEVTFEYLVEGKKTESKNVVVPEVIRCLVNVGYVEVSSINSNGKAWDYNFFAQNSKDNYPDMIYTVESDYNDNSRGCFGNVRFKSHKQKNVTKAAWTYPEDTIIYCKGDKLKVCVKDVDTIFDDSIGCFPLEELVKSKTFKNIQSGQVLRLDGAVYIIK